MTDQTETEQEDSGFPQAWRPTRGDAITGTLVNVEMIDPSGNGAYPCVTLMTGAGERNVHAFHSVLRRELARRRPKIGDELTIVYQGQKEGGKYGGYHAYQVRGGQGAEFNWDNELPAEERQSPPVQEVSVPPPPVVPPAGEQFGDVPF